MGQPGAGSRDRQQHPPGAHRKNRSRLRVALRHQQPRARSDHDDRDRAPLPARGGARPLVIRLIATDLDNTLLAADRRPHPRSAAAIQRAVEAGITVVLASGRIGHSIRGISEILGLEGPIIACNGADAFGPAGENWMHHRLDRTSLDLVLDFAIEHEVQANVYTREEVTFLGDSEWSRRYLMRLNQSNDRHIVVPRQKDADSVRTLDVSKVIFVDDPVRIQRYRRELEPQLNPHAARVTESEPEYLEFLAASASKGTGLRLVAERLGVPMEETAAIGDFLNDIEMLEAAGLSAAVGNAIAPVQKVVDRIVGTNDEGGVGEFIESILEGAVGLQ
ncbi:HAD family phosphatase [bacterium]|nr:MAG: HAD family phosphatase [bacterium]